MVAKFSDHKNRELKQQTVHFLAALHDCDMKLPDFTRLLHGVCEHNTKILFFFLNLDAVLSVSTPESFGNM